MASFPTLSVKVAFGSVPYPPAHAAVAASVEAAVPPNLPLTVVTNVNDSFVYTPYATGIPETFTVAAGTYATLAALIAAVGAAVGSAHGEAFSTIATPSMAP